MSDVQKLQKSLIAILERDIRDYRRILGDDAQIDKTMRFIRKYGDDVDPHGYREDVKLLRQAEKTLEAAKTLQ